MEGYGVIQVEMTTILSMQSHVQLCRLDSFAWTRYDTCALVNCTVQVLNAPPKQGFKDKKNAGNSSWVL